MVPRVGTLKDTLRDFVRLVLKTTPHALLTKEAGLLLTLTNSPPNSSQLP